MVGLLAVAGTLAFVRQGAVSASFDPATGIYQVSDRASGWSFLGQAIGQVTNVEEGGGHDNLGAYDEIAFTETVANAPARASIRTYSAVHAVKFRLEYRKAISGNGIVFPDFSAFPRDLHEFSYRDATFAPPTYGLAQTATPWLLFDDTGRSFIFSPASQFMVSRMSGDGKSSLGEGFDPRVQFIPAGAAQESVLVFGNRIGQTWSTWGEAMRRLYERSTPKTNSDPLLNKFGYWTDNGADYYYNYEPDKGYAGTLLALAELYRNEGIPLGYMQLDSWWYSKTIDDPDGKPGGATKNSKLPAGMWNRYGGLYEYRANKDLFPDGLAAFQYRLGLPLAVHDRWMDRNSPYHSQYKISGIGVTDPRWWQETAEYLASSNVNCYEQDWLDPIYANSPEMASTLGVGDAFTDGMAHAMAHRGLSLQYCMATPRFFLQGLKYPNLTTIRTSGDRFEPGKWADFLYGSQFADSMGIWPWCDVFKSRETGNMILSVLSAGPVGTGDVAGRESRENILKAARPDGVLVKPDAPLLPSDQTYLDAANHRDAPFWATTFTNHGGARTAYLFGFHRSSGTADPWSVPLRDAGSTGQVYLYDYLTGRGSKVRVDDPMTVTPAGRTEGRTPFDFAYMIAAPISVSGVAVIGDLGKWAPTGRQRIESIEDRRDGVHVRVLFARGERAITLDGISSVPPLLHATGGQATLRGYDSTSQRWSIELTPTARSESVELVIWPGMPPAKRSKR